MDSGHDEPKQVEPGAGMKYRLWIGAPLVLVGLGAAWILLRPQSDARIPKLTSLPPDKGIDGGNEQSRPSNPATNERPEQLPGETTAEKTRSQLQVHRLVVHVVDSNGAPIPGATCLWRSQPESDLSGLQVWGTEDWDLHEGAEQKVGCDSQGFASFLESGAPPSNVGTLVWVVAPQFEAAWSVVPPIEVGKSNRVEVALIKHGPLDVHVADPNGSPSEDAIVYVVGLNPAAPSNPPEIGRRAFRGFHATYRTEISGSIQIPPLPGSHVIWAEKGELRSVPLVDVSAIGANLTLRLGKCFTASGDVSWKDGSVFTEGMQVTAYAWDGAAGLKVAQARVRPDGIIAPFHVPLFDTDGYQFALRGGDTLPAWQDREVPAANSHVSLHFEVHPGVSIAVLVRDEQGTAVANARVTVDWDAKGGDTQVAVTNDDGLATVRGVYPGNVQVRAKANGYVPAALGTVNIAEAPGRELLLVMRRGGMLAGRVMYGGAPVENFTVVFWPTKTPQNRIDTEFRGAVGGQFRIEGVPLGDVLVYANTSELPRSEVRAAHIDMTVLADVLLELPEALTGRGQVVDGATSDPIPSAKIQLWNSYRAGYLTAFGMLHSVEPDGRFVITGFPPGDSRFVVQADGYSQHLGQAFGLVGEEIDLGMIAMQRTQRLQVRLTSTTPIDFTKFRSNADGNAAYPSQQFSVEGLVTWPEAGPNLYFVRVFLPDKSQMFLERYCRPGTDWEFVFPQDPTRTLEIAVVDTDGQPARIEASARVRLVYSASGGHQLTHFVRLRENSRAHFGTVAAKAVYAEVIGESGDRLGATTLALEDGANEARIMLGGKSVRVHVTNRDGVNLEGATLDARMAAGESPWFQLTSTDAAGMHTFTGLAMKRIFINVQHNQYGVKSDVHVDLETWKGEDTLEIVLDPRATVAVRLVDGMTPVVAASLRILGPQSGHIIGVFTTDSQGIVRYGPVTPGSYLISVEQPGVWLTEQLVEAGDKDIPRDVQVRKLGGLALRMSSGASQPAAGVRVELESVESGAKLSDWIQRGLVSVAGGVLLTDADGLAQVDGIPHGDYFVRVTSQAGSLVAGRATVNPGPVTNVALTIP